MHAHLHSHVTDQLVDDVLQRAWDESVSFVFSQNVEGNAAKVICDTCFRAYSKSQLCRHKMLDLLSLFPLTYPIRSVQLTIGK